MAVLIKSVIEMPRKLAAVSTTRFSSFVTRASSLSVRFAVAASAGNLFYLTKGVMIGMVVILGLAIILAPTRKKIEVKEVEPNASQ